MDAQSPRLNRRFLIKAGVAGLVTTGAGIVALEELAWKPKRSALAHSQTDLPDIQFQVGKFIAPPKTFNDGAGDVTLLFGPVFTLFMTMQLSRLPSKSDFKTWQDALDNIEAAYPFSPSGVITLVSYGLPYFNRLPQDLVSAHMPRLLKDSSRFALEEAEPSPTDFPNQKKKTFNVPVVIEQNDVLVTLRSDSTKNINDIVKWLQGSDSLAGQDVSSPDFKGLFTITSQRLTFTQIGLPRKVAERFNLPYASRINPDSPGWLGFSNQQPSAQGPAEIATFQGNDSARFVSLPDDYFKNGAIQHLSHNILDLEQYYTNDLPYTSRVQYMFRSDPIPSLGSQDDQFTDGGGPAHFNNDASHFLKFREQGTTEAKQTAKDIGKVGDGKNPINDPQPKTSPNPADVGKQRPRMGHLPALQQSSRAPDGTSITSRIGALSLDNMDVPDGSNQPKFHLTTISPTADFFATMRKNQAAVQFLAKEDEQGNRTTKGVPIKNNGIERFITATRRQNFLIPSRSHRVFPLLELVEGE